MSSPEANATERPAPSIAAEVPPVATPVLVSDTLTAAKKQPAGAPKQLSWTKISEAWENAMKRPLALSLGPPLKNMEGELFGTGTSTVEMTQPDGAAVQLSENEIQELDANLCFPQVTIRASSLSERSNSAASEWKAMLDSTSTELGTQPPPAPAQVSTTRVSNTLETIPG